MTPIQLAIAGVGKIVYDQHAPAIAGNADFKLVATASRNHCIEGVTAYKSMTEMLGSGTAIEAISLCMPPQYRYEAAREALAAGKHVFLENRLAPRFPKSSR
jgi:D-galactose 1-dehydrogenase